MGKQTRFSADTDFSKHVKQSALLAHNGSQHFYPRVAFITKSAGSADAGKPVRLGASGRLDSSLLLANIVDITDGVQVLGSGSDTINITHDGTDAFISWSYGVLTLVTDEGTNTVTLLNIKGKGTEYGAVEIFDQDDAEKLSLWCNSGEGYIGVFGTSVVSLRIESNANCDVKFFVASESGDNKYVYIYGYDTGAAGAKYIRINVASTGKANVQAEEILSLMSGDAFRMYLNYDAQDDISCFQGSGSGDNKYVYIYGYDTGASATRYLRFVVNSLGTGGIYAQEALDIQAGGSSSLYLQYNGNGSITCFQGSSSGENPVLYIYGYDTGAGAVKYGRMYVNTSGTLLVESEKAMALRTGGSGVFYLMDTANADVYVFSASTVGENRDLRVYGYVTAKGSASYLRLYVSDSIDGAVVSCENNSNLIGVCVYLPNAAHDFYIRNGSNFVCTFKNDGSIYFHYLNSGAGDYPVEYTTTTGELTYDTSDERQKDRIKDSPFGLDEILQIRPREFDYYRGKFESGSLVLRDSFTRTIGFVAQELYDVLPVAVLKPEDETKYFWSVKDKKLIPVLVRAIQQQQEQIECLEERLKKVQNGT